jgi:hypothetical protein
LVDKIKINNNNNNNNNSNSKENTMPTQDNNSSITYFESDGNHGVVGMGSVLIVLDLQA